MKRPRLKSTETLMAIILISLCGWTALIGLVVKPSFLVGAILAIAGGIAIGLVIVRLITCWWFKRP